MKIILELVVGHDFTGALALIGEDAPFEVGVGLGGACGSLATAVSMVCGLHGGKET